MEKQIEEEILAVRRSSSPEEAFWKGAGWALLYGIQKAKPEKLKEKFEKFKKHVEDGVNKDFPSAKKISKMIEDYRKEVLK